MGVKGRFCLFEELMKSINFTGVLFVLWSIGSAMAAPQWVPRAPPLAYSVPAAAPPELVVPKFQNYPDQDYYGGGCKASKEARVRGKTDHGRLIAVRLGLVRALDRHADVVGLLGRELRELDAERREVQRRDLLVEDFGERVHLVLARAAGEVLARVLLLPELELRERLVREGVRHDERRVARRAAEVEQAALGEDDGALAVRVDELVDPC